MKDETFGLIAALSLGLVLYTCTPSKQDHIDWKAERHNKAVLEAELNRFYTLTDHEH